MRLVRPLSLAALLLATTASLIAPPAASADERVARMTLEEKAGMVTGQNFWQTLEIERLGIPPAWMADGPVGLRKSSGKEVSESLPATCFPSSAAMAATWNPELIEQLGAGIGAEARFHDVALLLAPGLNLKRHPLGGRNFEYYSEDPLLAGKMAAAFVRGVQSQGVGATLKHYAVNNQEHRRMTIDAQVDERTMRELYLRGFEIAVKESQPQAIMSAYNRVNGTYASESTHLLSDILRGEWGYDGVVVSDWGAVDDPAASVAAGLDLEMPGNLFSPAEVARAVEEGRLDEADLDQAVARVLQLVDRQVALAELPKDADYDAHHELARAVAIEGMVLLENDGLLPIEGAGRKIGVAGNLAFRPRIQGVGSSQVNVTRLDVPWDHLEKIGGSHGHTLTAWQTEYDEKGMSDDERADLEQFLSEQEVVLVFAGQKASHDAEAWDRPSMSLSPADTELVAAARDSGKPFAVVLVGGGAVDVAAVDGAGAMLMGWLGGQAFGSAVAEVIFGDSAPSGRLSETFAHSAADHPSDLNFPAGPLAVYYGERFHVGYRHFQTTGAEVAYPFGHGLTYTSFAYGDASAPATLDSLDGGFDVSVEVTNTGERRGAETVQVYLRHLEPELERPDRELIGFHKLALDPGETGTATIHADADRLAYYHDGHGQWVIEPGKYEVLVAASAADVKATLPLEVTAGTKPRTIYTSDDIMGDIARDPRGLAIADFMLEMAGMRPLSGAAEDDFFAAIFRNMPFKKLASFARGKVKPEQLEQMMQLINSDMDPAMITAILKQAASAAQEAAQEVEE